MIFARKAHSLSEIDEQTSRILLEYIKLPKKKSPRRTKREEEWDIYTRSFSVSQTECEVLFEIFIFDVCECVRAFKSEAQNIHRIAVQLFEIIREYTTSLVRLLLWIFAKDYVHTAHC